MFAIINSIYLTSCNKAFDISCRRCHWRVPLWAVGIQQTFTSCVNICSQTQRINMSWNTLQYLPHLFLLNFMISKHVELLLIRHLGWRVIWFQLFFAFGLSTRHYAWKPLTLVQKSKDPKPYFGRPTRSLMTHTRFAHFKFVETKQWRYLATSWTTGMEKTFSTQKLHAWSMSGWLASKSR